MTNLVVPDSIEPYVGYKSLAVIRGGTLLCSPQQMSFVWKPQQRAEATCQVPLSYHWTLVPEDAEIHWPEVGTTSFTAVSSSTQFFFSFTAPVTDAPEGQAWSWEPMTHKVADQRCSCGIYAVDRPQEGLYGYIADSHVIAKVALWGTVTRGNKGARGQYAYPQEIVGWTTKHHEKIAEIYGIPVNPDPSLNMLVGESVGINRARARARAAQAAMQAGGASFQGAGSVVSSGSRVVSSGSRGFSSAGLLLRIAAFGLVAGGGAIALAALLHPIVSIAWSLALSLIWIYYCRKHA